MLIGELFATKVAEDIDPVIKVSERSDETKLAGEIANYVVTPLIEKYVDDFFEHYTDTIMKQTTEIGAWISGYFGSGKSHLAKIMALVAENAPLAKVSAAERFLTRIPPDADRRQSLERNLATLGRCHTSVLAFNLNTLADSKSRPLPQLLLSQYYQSKGYCGNLIYARVIEAELDKEGKLDELHREVERRSGKSWSDIQKNPTFFSRHLMEAAATVSPEAFANREEVERALNEAQKGELFNVSFLLQTIRIDLETETKKLKREHRLLFVLDEAGQWIENDANRLSQLQALIEEAAVVGQGRVWIIVTTHGDMGSIYKEARALEADMKKIEGRFRFKFGLTTENIELVLEDRLFRKSLGGRQELERLYDQQSGVLRGLGELSNTSQTLPDCSRERFVTYYPFFPYQIHLIPEVVKSLRSKGGRGEQLSGSTRTLLAICQDILRAGRRHYLEDGVGALVSFDEVYENLAGEGEVSPDVRTELSRIAGIVPDATPLTGKVAEALFLVKELAYIPRTKENLARLLAEEVGDDLPGILNRLDPEIDRLKKAKLLAEVGAEYEFLTGERRTFEEEVSAVEAEIKQQERERGLADHFVQSGGARHWNKWLTFDRVSYLGTEFPFALFVDDRAAAGSSGDIPLKLYTPLLAQGTVTLGDVESASMQAGEHDTLFVVCGRVRGFDRDLDRFLAMKEVIDRWKGDVHRSEEARNLAQEREYNDLPKLGRKVNDGLLEGIRTGSVVFRGSSRSVNAAKGQKPGDALRDELATYWSQLYPKFDLLPVRITNDQKAIQEVLAGTGAQNRDLRELKLIDGAGKINSNAVLLDSIRIHLAAQQGAGRAVYGKELVGEFSRPPYGWDPNAVRVGVAALLRSGGLKLSVNKKGLTNPADREVVDLLRVSRSFEKAEIILDAATIDPDVLTETRALLIKIGKKRSIDETPAAISEAAGLLAREILEKAERVALWASGAGFPFSDEFTSGVETWRSIEGLANPIHRVNEIHSNQDTLQAGFAAIGEAASFQSDHASQFTDLAQFVDSIRPAGHLLEPGSSAEQLIEAFAVAKREACFTEKATWKHLQMLKAEAALEVQTLVDKQRSEAQGLLSGAAERIRSETAELGLDKTVVDELVAPLQNMLERLERPASPAEVVFAPQQAEAIVKFAGDRIAQEAKRGKPSAPGAGKSEKPVQKLRVSEVSSITLVATEEEWAELEKRLDEKVRTLLREGKRVELL